MGKHPVIEPALMTEEPAAIARRDEQWLETVFRRNEPQLTVRAALTGI